MVLFLGSLAGGLQEQSSPSSPQEQTKPRRVRVSSGVAQRLLVNRLHVEYPKDARKQRIQGMVTLSISIDTNGDVTDARLISGHPALAQAAIDAVKRLKYKPFLLDGQAMEVETQVQVNFTLAGG
jgi:protein TonB